MCCVCTSRSLHPFKYKKVPYTVASNKNAAAHFLVDTVNINPLQFSFIFTKFLYFFQHSLHHEQTSNHIYWIASKEHKGSPNKFQSEVVQEVKMRVVKKMELFRMKNRIISLHRRSPHGFIQFKIKCTATTKIIKPTTIYHPVQNPTTELLQLVQPQVLSTFESLPYT